MFATSIVLLGTSILWLGALSLLFHLPEFPRFIIVVVYLLSFLVAAPGFLVTFLPIPKGDPSFVAGIIFAWLFYFALCRRVLMWRGARVKR
jgi:hypothetical protein